MTTPLEKTLKRALTLKGSEYVLAISPAGLKITEKGKRNGLELGWESLISGEAALAVALQASVGKVAAPPAGSSDKAGSKGDGEDQRESRSELRLAQLPGRSAEVRLACASMRKGVGNRMSGGVL